MRCSASSGESVRQTLSRALSPPGGRKEADRCAMAAGSHGQELHKVAPRRIYGLCGALLLFMTASKAKRKLECPTLFGWSVSCMSVVVFM